MCGLCIFLYLGGWICSKLLFEIFIYQIKKDSKESHYEPNWREKLICTFLGAFWPITVVGSYLFCHIFACPVWFFAEETQVRMLYRIRK